VEKQQITKYFKTYLHHKEVLLQGNFTSQQYYLDNKNYKLVENYPHMSLLELQNNSNQKSPKV
jgi:hypothetical protein